MIFHPGGALDGGTTRLVIDANPEPFCQTATDYGKNGEKPATLKTLLTRVSHTVENQRALIDKNWQCKTCGYLQTSGRQDRRPRRPASLRYVGAYSEPRQSPCRASSSSIMPIVGPDNIDVTALGVLCRQPYRLEDFLVRIQTRIPSIRKLLPLYFIDHLFSCICRC